MKAFFDSSAFAKRYIMELGSDRVEKICSQSTMLGVSSVCLPEIISALCRLRRNSGISEDQYKNAKEALLRDLEDVFICNITPSVIKQSIHILETSQARSLDALHIACALEFEAETFVSSDIQQLSAARTAGMKVLRV
ncbi:MAG: type II toxin-antitoxin system VapC family toxin [Deltaproteobacteria bacterium]|nr:type II toxin-antitoxin system VapC family toxin [Deltaproteobacteria bacterium]MBM4346930.1 type II toxin-antitoxin system VapC family toxin [Deltaproteobacteria bacterium]